MTAKRTIRGERRQRYLRGLRGEKAGVSPVVATLILILIAVAAAAALYLWLVAWQGNVTGGIGQPNAQYTVTIGGSTSVYPFSQLAATWFQQNNSNIVISDNQGGTGAGMLAVCQGHIMVGASSSLQTQSGLIASDGCPSTPGLTITTIAYDAVDVVVAGANSHALQSIYYDTLAAIYAGASTTGPSLLYSSIDGQSTGVAPLNVAPWSTHAALAWDQIPACVMGAATCGGAGNPTEAAATSIGAGIACTTGADICANAGASPCGFTVCAGPFTGTTALNLIKPVQRSDGSGTTQSFEARLLDAASATTFIPNFAYLATSSGFGGCGGNNVLSDCGINVPTQGNGNPGVLSAVAGSSDAIGYASDGLARTTAGVGTSGIIAYLALGETTPVTSGSTYFMGGVVPTTGHGGSISAGIQGLTTVNQYAGWRPFEFVTLQPPTGEVQRFIEFVTSPANNIELAQVTQEVSIYSV